MNGNASDGLSEINQLINDVEERLVAKFDERRDAKDEAERALQQLLEVQSRLEQEILNHVDTCRGKDALERKLAEAKEESELVLLQLHQVQEELELMSLQYKDEQKKLRRTQQDLEYYFLESLNLKAQLNRQADKLDWLRGQRELLMRMVLVQSRRLRKMMALDARVAIPMLRLQSMSWWRRITLR
jgi:chromosome segregation ATPase